LPNERAIIQSRGARLVEASPRKDFINARRICGLPDFERFGAKRPLEE